MYSHNTQTTLITWFVSALLAAAATCTPALWSLDTELVRQGELWRLVSGHLVHLNWQHYLYDLLALGLVLFLCRMLEAGFATIAFVALCSAGAVSLSLMVLQPVEVYGGLSGVSAGLLSWAALQLIRQESPAIGALLIAGMLIKIWLERHGGSASGVVAVWQAHCAGGLAGALVFAVSQKLYVSIGGYQNTRSTP
jgi:rhomboid family GlyGly-CTERM serine protease